MSTEAAARYKRFLDVPAQTCRGSRLIELARGGLHLFDPPGLAAATGILAPATPFIAGFALASSDVDATRALLAEHGAAIRAIASKVIAVSPGAIDTTIIFTAPDSELPWSHR